MALAFTADYMKVISCLLLGPALLNCQSLNLLGAHLLGPTCRFNYYTIQPVIFKQVSSVYKLHYMHGLTGSVL